MDVQRLIKILAMTTSGHDGEALNAIRKANAMLKEHGKRWEDIVTTRMPLPKRSEHDIMRERQHSAYTQAQRGYNPYPSNSDWTDIDIDFDNVFRRKV